MHRESDEYRKSEYFKESVKLKEKSVKCKDRSKILQIECKIHRNSVKYTKKKIIIWP